jgi:hypothetical protein
MHGVVITIHQAQCIEVANRKKAAISKPKQQTRKQKRLAKRALFKYSKK